MVCGNRRRNGRRVQSPIQATSAGSSSPALPRRLKRASADSGVCSGLISTTGTPAPSARYGRLAAGCTSDEVPILSTRSAAATACSALASLLLPLRHRPVAGRAADPGDIAVQLDYPVAAGALVQSVDVLRHHRQAGPAGCPLRQRVVSGIRLHLRHLGTAHGVPLPHPQRVAGKAFRRGQLHRIVFCPQALLGVAEGGHPAFRRDAGTGQGHDPLRLPQQRHQLVVQHSIFRHHPYLSLNVACNGIQ